VRLRGLQSIIVCMVVIGETFAESSPVTAWIIGSRDTVILPLPRGNGAASSGSGRKSRTKLAAMKQELTRGIKSQGSENGVVSSIPRGEAAAAGLSASS